MVDAAILYIQFNLMPEEHLDDGLWLCDALSVKKKKSTIKNVIIFGLFNFPYINTD